MPGIGLETPATLGPVAGTEHMAGQQVFSLVCTFQRFRVIDAEEVLVLNDEEIHRLPQFPSKPWALRDH